MSYQIRAARAAEAERILELLPRLAAFSIPERRTPEHLWQGDAELLLQWARGGAPQCLVLVATAGDEAILGVAMASLREELLSHAPSVHLEVLAVRGDAEGRGIGKALVSAIEQAARERGATSMTLHVFATNHRARAVYEQLGYDGELLRYIKHFE